MEEGPMTNKEAPYPVILGRYAGFFSRGAAWVIDRAIIFGITTVVLLIIDFFFGLFGIDDWLASLNSESTVQGLAILFSSVGIFLLVSIGYNIGFWLLSGQTPGKRVLGVRVIRKDGTRLKMGNAVRRQIGYWISAIFFLGYLWILVDNKRRGFHDILAGTMVTYSWPEGRMRGTFVIERVQRYKDRSKT
jgi:uncharacterized RDD family membrane protein YckC